MKHRLRGWTVIAPILIAAAELISAAPAAIASDTSSSSSVISAAVAASLAAFNRSAGNNSQLSALNYLAPASPSWPTLSNWYTYGWNPQRTGYNNYENVLSPSNISQLGAGPIWTYKVPRAVTSSLIAVNGTLYFGAWNGNLYALNATGPSGALRYVWNTSLTNAVPTGAPAAPRNCQLHGGIYSTPTYWNNTIYVTAGNQNFSALTLGGKNLSTQWPLNVTQFSSHHGTRYQNYTLWSSPLIAGGMAYIGLASTCDQPYDKHLQQGQLLRIPITGTSNLPNLATGVFNVTPANGPHWVNLTGGGIWSSASVDRSTSPFTIWITTGNENPNGTPPVNCAVSPCEPWARSIIGLNSSNLARPLIVQQFGKPGFDQDFGAGPTLYKNGSLSLVGALNKDGIFHAIKRSNGVWALNFSRWSANDFGISPAAYDGTYLYVSGPPNATSNNGTVAKIDPTTGGAVWVNRTNSTGVGGSSLAGVTLANGLVIDASNAIVCNPYCFPNGAGTLEVRSAATGKVLWHFYANRSIDGAPIVSIGHKLTALTSVVG